MIANSLLHYILNSRLYTYSKHYNHHRQQQQQPKIHQTHAEL